MNQQYQTTQTQDSTEQQSAPTEVTVLQTPPSLHEKYTLIREIGHGTQGRIYLAERNSDHTKVAIKQLNIESVKNWKAYDLFQREAQTLASLHIDGVAKFYEAIECLEDTPPCSYIVQEYIHAQSLSDMLKAGHRFSLNRVYDIIMQLLDILKQLHSHEPPVIHRDIKPSNILLKALGGDDYEVYLIDFGAVANPQVQGGGSTVAGTFGYMAPEQLTGKPCPASDIYSLAAVAVYLISGRSPADMPMKDFHLIFEPDMQNMPVSLVNTLRAMLEPDLNKRLSDIDTLTERFLNYYRSVYQTQDSQTTAFSESQLLERLQNVQHYGEDGNLDIWQSLPDETPRSLPELAKAFRFFTNFNIHPPEFENYCFDEYVKKRVHELALEGQQLDRWERTSFKDQIKSGWIGLFIGSVILSLSFIKLSLKAFFIALVCSFAFFIVLYLFYILILFIGHLLTLSQRGTSGMLQSIGAKDRLSARPSYRTFYKNLFIGDKRSELMEHGRKTIATICDIAYLPVSDDNTEDVYLDPAYYKELNYNNHNICAFACHGTPCFEIRYKFNPPDDKREADIVHSIIVHEDPTPYLKIGDPLPILYRILPTEFVNGIKPEQEASDEMQQSSNTDTAPQNKQRNLTQLATNARLHPMCTQRVVSMPFPYPLSDPTDILEVQGCDEYCWDAAKPSFQLQGKR